MKRKWWTVAAHEFGLHIKRKGFLISTLGMPLFFALAFGLIFLFIARGESPKGVGYIDQSGITKNQPDRVVITDTLQPDVPLIRYTDEALARADTNAKKIDGFVIIAADYLQTGSLKAIAPNGDLPSVSKDALGTFLTRSLISNEPNQSATRLNRLIKDVRNRTLSNDRETTRGQGIMLFFTPYLFGIFFFIAVFSSSSYLMTALVEEKENRVMEILATSLRPFSLMAGKILGLGLLGLVQIAVWLAVVIGGFLFAKTQFKSMESISIPTDVLLIGALMFVPAYLLVAACLSAIGAAVTTVQEGQQFSGFVSLLMISPVWALPVIMKAPNGTLATILSMFPFTAPIVMMQRVALTNVPWWQIGVTMTLLVASAIGMMWLAARIVRVGMLRYGKRMSFAEIRRAFTKEAVNE